MFDNRFFLSILSLVLVTGIGSSFESVFAVPGQGTLYATEPFHCELWTIDPSNGFAILKGNTQDGGNSVKLPSLAVHPFTGVMYAGGGGGGAGPDDNCPDVSPVNSPNLYIVDPNSGDLTLVGATNQGNLLGLDFRSDGTLFAALKLPGVSGGSALGIVNPATGATNLVGLFGVDSLNGIAFFGNTLFGVSYNDELYTINTGTGEATLATVVIPSVGLGAAQFSCDSTLYVGEGAIGALFGTLDITTGDLNALLDTALEETIGGFAFIENCPPVGGELLSIDSTALMLVGLQTSAIWMLPVLAVAAGQTVWFVHRRMKNNSS